MRERIDAETGDSGFWSPQRSQPSIEGPIQILQLPIGQLARSNLATRLQTIGLILDIFGIPRNQNSNIKRLRICRAKRSLFGSRRIADTDTISISKRRFSRILVPHSQGDQVKGFTNQREIAIASC